MLDIVVWKDLIMIMNFSCYKFLGEEEGGGEGIYVIKFIVLFFLRF